MIKKIILFIMLAATHSSNISAVEKPQPLRSGDTIALVAPARPTEPADIAAICNALKQKGFKVVISDNASTRRGYLAGSDEERAKALMQAWCNPSIKMVWCIGGGYGSTRILELLDFKKMRKFKKIFVGMSDITALHCAFHKELNLVTFLGPMPIKLYITDKDASLRNLSLEHLWQMVQGNTSLPARSPNVPSPSKTIKSGKAIGRLVGGNLTLIASLVGTPWQIETKGNVLILEDINEEPYAIDRKFRQLKHAGMLNAPAAVVLSSWTNCHAKQPAINLSLEQVFDDYFKNAPYPVFAGYPSGHIEGQLTLPLNTLVEVDASKRQLTIMEKPIEENSY